MFHKPREYKKVVRLRKKGQGYNRIAKAVGISKSTISQWCRNLELPEEVQKIIGERIKRNKNFQVLTFVFLILILI